VNIASELTSGRIRHFTEIGFQTGKRQRNLLWYGLPQQVRQWSRKVAKVMDEFGVEVAELHETANIPLRRRHWPVYNGLDFLC
jgi:hypothetical protein